MISDKNNELKIVDFYFTNSVEDLKTVKDIFELNNIPNEIIRNNNRHPYFGVNTAIGLDRNLNDYVIRIPENYIDAAELLLSEAFDDEDNKDDDAVMQIDERESSEEKTKSSLGMGYFVMLLFISHYTRYFYCVKNIDQNAKMKSILKLAGVVWLSLDIIGHLALCLLITDDLIEGICTSIFMICIKQAIINLIDFIIERQKLQLYFFLLMGFVVLLEFNHIKI